MSGARPPQRVFDELPAGEPVYAVLDGARNRWVRGFVLDSGAPRWCLFRGALPPPLEDVAPWLMRLVPGHPYTDRFLARGWNDNWGILLSCSSPPDDLRRHLRRFLLARTEDGMKLLFRYYDPRVLRIYLPTCTGDELKKFFGTIQAFAMPDEGEDGLVVSRLVEGKLEQRRA